MTLPKLVLLGRSGAISAVSNGRMTLHSIFCLSRRDGPTLAEPRHGETRSQDLAHGVALRISSVVGHALLVRPSICRVSGELLPCRHDGPISLQFDQLAKSRISLLKSVLERQRPTAAWLQAERRSNSSIR